jgi:hypothetical protein
VATVSATSTEQTNNIFAALSVGAHMASSEVTLSIIATPLASDKLKKSLLELVKTGVKTFSLFFFPLFARSRGCRFFSCCLLPNADRLTIRWSVATRSVGRQGTSPRLERGEQGIAQGRQGVSSRER